MGLYDVSFSFILLFDMIKTIKYKKFISNDCFDNLSLVLFKADLFDFI